MSEEQQQAGAGAPPQLPSTDGEKVEEHGEQSLTLGSPSAEDKSLTFRKRRLSLTNLKEVAAQAEAKSKEGEGAMKQEIVAPEDDNPFEFEAPQLEPSQSSETKKSEEDEKAHTFRKRRLSLNLKREEPSEGTLPEMKVQVEPNPDQAVAAAGAAAGSTTGVGGGGSSVDGSVEQQHPPLKRSRRNSEATAASFETVDGVLKSKVVHAAELTTAKPTLLRQTSTNRLYQQSAPPQQPNMLEQMIGKDASNAPKWNKRHTRHVHEDERKLPFPRDIVGTYSCHGVEPIYDDDDFDDDDEDDFWQQQPLSTDDPNRPTTAAKINQDRGGVAFPYANCRKTALFSAYDGKSYIPYSIYPVVKL